ncbi:hypothetical protein U9M48_012786, partial [Paspalum notatum var. saurae]
FIREKENSNKLGNLDKSHAAILLVPVKAHPAHRAPAPAAKRGHHRYPPPSSIPESHRLPFLSSQSGRRSIGRGDGAAPQAGAEDGEEATSPSFSASPNGIGRISFAAVLGSGGHGDSKRVEAKIEDLFKTTGHPAFQLNDQMTCRMSASKQKKRQTNCTNSEQCRPGKKTKFDSQSCLITLKPHINLKWDQYLRRVVPAKEQVGILWSDLAPFIESPKYSSGLADVTNVPPEIFSLNSLRGVLSFEVWSTCLTEAERKSLIQFLPSETDAEENVHMLLSGKNHHFGNPFLIWQVLYNLILVVSSSLCYGDIHPDALLNKEKHIKKDEKAYRVNLHNYHSNMVESLKKWRKRWLNCGDTENLFRDNPGNQMHGAMQLKATKSVMPMKVAQRIDISKFMSYIEVSRTQLNHIKRLKQSGDGIQTKHVSRVIGGLDKSHVKPYGALLEDEQRRLREHWLNMSCNDLPAAFEVLKDRNVLMEKSRKLLGLELQEKNASVLRKVRCDLSFSSYS